MSSTHETHTILIVDDEERLRKGLARSFRQEDYRTLSAASGEEALRLLKTRRIDLVITDLVMPGMGGTTLVRNIRNVLPDVQIIIITAYGSAKSMQEAEELGVTCYMAKPFDLSDLKSEVSKLLAASSVQPSGPDRAVEMSSPSEPSHSSGLVGTKGALCSICHARRKALSLLSRLVLRSGPLRRAAKALPYIKPRNVMLAFGRASRAASGLAGRRHVVRSVRKSLSAAAGLSRKVLPHVKPRNLILALGRAASRITAAWSGLRRAVGASAPQAGRRRRPDAAASDLPSVFTRSGQLGCPDDAAKKGVKGKWYT